MRKAIIFDLDGTLIDTESLAVKAGLQAFSEVGFPVELSFLHQLVGRDEPSGAAIIAAAYPDLDRVLLQQRWGDGFRAGMAGNRIVPETDRGGAFGHRALEEWPQRKAIEGAARERAADDERRVTVHLTDAGRALEQRAAEVPGALAAQLADDATEYEVAKASLTALVERLEASNRH